MLHTRTQLLSRTTNRSASCARIARLSGNQSSMPFSKVFRRVPSLSVDSKTGSATTATVPAPSSEPEVVADSTRSHTSNASNAERTVYLKLRLGSCNLPHPDKASYGGEDAYFTSNVGGGAIGIADGVGGWQESGVNPAEYSRTLMHMAKAYLERTDRFACPDDEPGTHNIDPRGALAAAHQHTKVPGSATACIVQLDQETGSLLAANLGDSGFLIIRDKKVLLRSRPLQHYFDCPLQFGAFPEFVEATDTAEQAEMYNVKLLPGDVIIAGTDGLWDNVYEAEILQFAPKTADDVEHAAEMLATTARKHAADNDFASPYTREAISQGFDLPWWEKLLGASYRNGKFQLKQLTGGKMDDITVVVALAEVLSLNNQSDAGGSASASLN